MTIDNSLLPEWEIAAGKKEKKLNRTCGIEEKIGRISSVEPAPFIRYYSLSP
ncbi:MAG TPA: hypothetical protein PLV96_12975 [Methanoregulaceae archaeon]|nr:hypothetical protein [Methanoregulaceae archaeon]